MLDFFSFDDFDSRLLSFVFLFSGPVTFSVDFSVDFSVTFSMDFSMDFDSLVVFSDDNFSLSVFVSFSFVDFLDGDFSETSETEDFLDLSVLSELEFFSLDFEPGVTGVDALSVDFTDDFSVGFSDDLSDFLSEVDLTGVDDIGLFDSSGFELFKIDFIVGLGLADTTSTLSFTTVFDPILLSDFFGDSVLPDFPSDFLSAGLFPASFSSDFDFSLGFSPVDSFVAGAFDGSGIGS